MSILAPFRAYRPTADKAAEVASRPYDVLNTEEARKEADLQTHSFLHVIKPEIDFDDEQNPYAPEVYAKGKENFDTLCSEGVMVQDETECLYVYQLIMDGHEQTGLVGCNSIDDYFNNVIKKHELTRTDKEEDRKRHVREGKMNAEPVFFSYPAIREIDEIVEQVKGEVPTYDFLAEDGVQHTLWVISDSKLISTLVDLFEQKVPSIYVADGHHRTAAGALVGKELREADGADPDGRNNYFMSVLFPDNQLNIMDYNRVVKDLNGLSPQQVLEKIGENFDVEEVTGPHKPSVMRNFGVYMDGKWYSITAKDGTYDNSDPILALDVTILSRFVLEPILNIGNLRTDKRIDFVGGIRGMEELERRVDNGEMQVAFSMYPVQMQQLINISDTGMIMPPKTTWFEPKLRSGLFVHQF
jgi:uncharacterized protein (DUF1015 family)